MTILFAIILIFTVSAFIVSPLLQQTANAGGDTASAGNELWNREKATAVLAITEADFDRATGKLSDDDYRILRSDYEGRALQAMDEIEKLAPVAGTSSGSYCAQCGAACGAVDRFCGSCGNRRLA